MTRKTLEDILISQGKPSGVQITCPNCKQMRFAFEILDVRDTPEIEDDDVCTHCLVDYERGLAEKAFVEAKAGVQGWDSDEGAAMRAGRNQRLDASLWAVQPGTPLTPECQVKFIEYRKALNRLTVDFSIPAEVVWPDQPTLVYE